FCGMGDGAETTKNGLEAPRTVWSLNVQVPLHFGFCGIGAGAENSKNCLESTECGKWPLVVDTLTFQTPSDDHGDRQSGGPPSPESLVMDLYSSWEEPTLSEEDLKSQILSHREVRLYQQNLRLEWDDLEKRYSTSSSTDPGHRVLQSYPMDDRDVTLQHQLGWIAAYQEEMTLMDRQGPVNKERECAIYLNGRTLFEIMVEEICHCSSSSGKRESGPSLLIPSRGASVRSRRKTLDSGGMKLVTK
ncbi:uncharacterized protein LOC143022531, partial [Oratosquilla oratoria]|uniref:uncharacterized protein LOC143022531 n=1 Tax=Oratosquilla oratoria TaxID=337810 RepID=UPI003F7715F5